MTPYLYIKFSKYTYSNFERLLNLQNKKIIFKTRDTKQKYVFQKLHKDNLEHHPLPDTVPDAMYQKMQMEREAEPGLALKEGNFASGVAWKGYGGYGPTRCTKLTVFRPKTSISNKIKDSADDRPSSVSSFDKKWRFIRKQKVMKPSY